MFVIANQIVMDTLEYFEIPCYRHSHDRILASWDEKHDHEKCETCQFCIKSADLDPDTITDHGSEEEQVLYFPDVNITIVERNSYWEGDDYSEIISKEKGNTKNLTKKELFSCEPGLISDIIYPLLKDKLLDPKNKELRQTFLEGLFKQ